VRPKCHLTGSRRDIEKAMKPSHPGKQIQLVSL
jgi:hypothetical protein